MTDALSDVNLASVLGILTVSSIVIFFAIWFLLNVFYRKTSGRWAFVNRFIEKTRGKGEHPLIKKYGLIGIALLIAIPLPTFGVYGGTLLSWMMGMKWRSSLIAIVSGSAVSNIMVLLSLFGIRHMLGLFG